MPFVTRDGARLYWRVDGDPAKPALLLGNSLGTDHTLWEPVLLPLARDFRVIRFDKPGHGASEPRGGEYRIEMLARDALAVADAAGARRFSYVGISIGGMIGQWLGANAGERIERLVLSNTAQKMDSAVYAERIPKVLEGGVAVVADLVLQRWFTERFLARGDERLAIARSTLLGVDRIGYAGCCAALRDMDLTDLAPRIRVPTLVVTGTHDLATPKSAGEAIAAAVPGAQRVELPSAHIPVVEMPQLYAHTLLAFLARRDVVSERDRYEVGLEKRKQALGAAYVEERVKRITPFNAEFQELITRLAWGEIWTRDVLDDRTRRLLVLAICVSLGRWEEFELHARAGLAAELGESDLKEMLLLAAVYAGVPAANTAFHKAAALLAQK